MSFKLSNSFRKLIFFLSFERLFNIHGLDDEYHIRENYIDISLVQTWNHNLNDDQCLSNDQCVV